MKYELLGKYNGMLIETILHNRGITDTKKILNPTHENDTNVLDLPNINLAVRTFVKNLSKKILILVDSDVDGFTSSAIIYKYIKFANPLADVNYFVHSKKSHGITKEFMGYVAQHKPDLIIVPDAGTNDTENRQQLIKNGIDLIIIDHHEEEKLTENGGILINNHAKFPENNINKNLTGAGMTYLFCKAVEMEVQTGRLNQLMDLAMLGLIGDSADLTDNEVRRMCVDGLKNINSQLIKTLYEEKSDNLIFKDLSWGGIIPLINSVVRVGETDERKLIFKALVDLDLGYTEIVQKRKLNKETRKYEVIDFEYNIYQLAIDAGEKSKNKQNRILNAELKKSDSQFNSETGIQIFITENEDAKGLTGLIANKLKSQWEQPTLVMWLSDDKTVYNGSLRGYEKTMPNFKKWCLDTGLFDLVQGHDNAAGIVLKAENLDKLIECAKNVESEEMKYKIDILYQENVNVSHVFELDNNKHIFGNGIDEPLFMVKNLKVPAHSISWSKKTLKLKAGEMTYIKFGVSEEEYKELKAKISNYGSFDVVGRFEVNEWGYRKYPQMIITEYELLTETKTDTFESVPTPFDYGMFA